MDLSQYYKGKTIIIESLFNSYLIVAPFAKIWQYPIINDKQGEEHFIHRNKITYGSLCGYIPKALRYAPIGIAKILLYEVIKGFKYCSLFPIFEETLPYKFKPIFI